MVHCMRRASGVPLLINGKMSGVLSRRVLVSSLDMDRVTANSILKLVSYTPLFWWCSMPASPRVLGALLSVGLV
jgi:hypothetical protein